MVLVTEDPPNEGEVEGLWVQRKRKRGKRSQYHQPLGVGVPSHLPCPIAAAPAVPHLCPCPSLCAEAAEFEGNRHTGSALPCLLG